MSIRDTGIEDWSATPANNPPSDVSFVRADLAPQYQNQKSILRGLSLELEWERTGLLTANATHSGGGLGLISFFSSDGNLTARFPTFRKLRLRPSSGVGTVVYCAVASSSHSGTTSVILCELVGLLSAGVEYRVDLGLETPGKDALPLYGQSGSVTITDPAQTADATFDHKEPDTDYFVKCTVISSSAAGVTGAGFIATVVKTQTKATIGLAAVPTGGATNVGWTLLREL